MNKNLSFFCLLSILTCCINTPYAKNVSSVVFDDERTEIKNIHLNSGLEKVSEKNSAEFELSLEKDAYQKNVGFFNRAPLSNLIEDLSAEDFLSMPIIKVGDYGKSVDLLLKAMFHRGIIADWFSGMVVTGEIEELIKVEQKKFGLKPDGIAGPLFYHALYYGGEEIKEHFGVFKAWKKTKIEEARSAGYSNIVVVNIPSYRLSVFDTDSGKEILNTTVIVGALNSKTPIMLTYIINLKHNPDWSPPPSARARGKKYTPPGPDNPLGLMRFSANNNLNIYLHDTNQKNLFKKNFKAMSMGCVRVDNWKTLAAILRGSTVDDMIAINKRGKTFYEKIQKTPVYIVYSRADKIGDLPMIFPDVYNKLVYFVAPLSTLERK